MIENTTEEPKQQPPAVDGASLAPFTFRDLLIYFLRLGTLGFGGPIALAGYMQRELVEGRRWVSKQDYLEGLAFSQLSPGPLAAQLAMYLGWLRAGGVGATLVGITFILPSFLMVLALAALYVHYGSLPWIQGMFYGIGAAVIAIIVRSAIKLVCTTVGRDWLLWAIFGLIALTTAWTRSEIVWLFVLCGIIGVLLKAPPKVSSTAAAMVFIGGFDRLWTGMYGLAPLATVGALFLFFLKAGAFVFGIVAAPYYRRFAQNRQVKAFVQGVTAAAVGAIAGAAYILARRSLVDLPTVLIGLITLTILILTKKIPEPILILVAGAAGVLLHGIAR